MESSNKNMHEPANEMESNITPEERALLDDSFVNSISRDNENLKKSSFDNTDMEGLPLNENSFLDDFTGEGLDIPGAELDNLNEDIGEEDEENNGYSQADTE